MPRIENGVIVTDASSTLPADNGKLNLCGYSVPLWGVVAGIVVASLIGGVQGGLVATGVVGVVYCTSQPSNPQNTSQVKSFYNLPPH